MKNCVKVQTALAHTPASIVSTSTESPATRQSTGTPTLDVDQQQDDTLDQVVTISPTVAPESGSTLVPDTIPDCPPGIFTPLTDQSTKFHVFPHKGSAKLVASINVSLMHIAKLPNED
jgi:hypothetical protein